MSDLQHTAIKNWLQATADDAMGMEPGDRAMAHAAKYRIEELERQLTTWRGHTEETYTELLDIARARIEGLEAVVEAAICVYHNPSRSRHMGDLGAALAALEKNE